MNTLVSGSIAYDYIMDFPDSFKNHILPDQIHILNVCFVVEKLNKNFGGCATNIAYTMKLLESNPIMFAPVGKDGRDFLEFFEENKINKDYIPKSKELLTASAHITTDKDGNQVIAYYNGATSEANNMKLEDVKENIDLAIIAPTQKDAMIKHAKECFDKKIPFCFDPSHQLTAFSSQELMAIIGQAKFYIGNDYEIKLTEEKTGWDQDELLNHVEVLIITLGEKGSIIKTKDQTFEIKSCPANSVEDPTGAGDAYRGGFFSAYTEGQDYQTCGQVASVASTYAVENYGTVNHKYTKQEFDDRYKENYEEASNLKI
jgi:adenosine kinase